MEPLRVTQGHGLLEVILAYLRERLANRLIPATHRTGRLLDIGCGTFPLFLSKTNFAEKYGVDKIAHRIQCGGNYFEARNIKIKPYDAEQDDTLPFENNFFDVVTMLAVLEHIHPQRVTRLLKEIQRVLKPGGIYIVTTPPPWTDVLLRIMSKIGLISSVEMRDHKAMYTPSKLRSLLELGNFAPGLAHVGYFEMFLNIWARTEKNETE